MEPNLSGIFIADHWEPHTTVKLHLSKDVSVGNTLKYMVDFKISMENNASIKIHRYLPIFNMDTHHFYVTSHPLQP